MVEVGHEQSFLAITKTTTYVLNDLHQKSKKLIYNKEIYMG
jgi:hypothetical protein